MDICLLLSLSSNFHATVYLWWWTEEKRKCVSYCKGRFDLCGEISKKICCIPHKFYRKRKNGGNIWRWAFNLQYRAFSFFVILLIWLQLRITGVCIIYIYICVYGVKKETLSRRRRRTTMIKRRKKIMRSYLYIYQLDCPF